MNALNRMIQITLFCSVGQISVGQNSTSVTGAVNSVAELHGKNVVIYPDALNDDAGFQASIRYRFTRDGFEQDVILTSGLLPTPEEFGLDRATTVLEVLTEFFDPPAPVKGETKIISKSGEEVVDERLDFSGVMEMGAGKAFSQGLDGDEEAVPVTKQWIKMESRDFLIEQVRFNDILPSLEKLPKPDGAGLLPKLSPVKRLASLQRKLPSPPKLADKVRLPAGSSEYDSREPSEYAALVRRLRWSWE